MRCMTSSPFRWTLWILSLPWNALVLVAGAITGFWWWAARSWRLDWSEGVPILCGVWRDWIDKDPDDPSDTGFWRYSTTFGHVILFQRRHLEGRNGERLQQHERRHVRQLEDEALRAFVLGVIVVVATDDWLLAIALVATAYAHLATNFLSALLRGGNPYRDAEHERSAYAQTDVGPDGRSWEERQR